MQGDGKDLGHILEFKTEVQLSYGIPQRKRTLEFLIIIYLMLVLGAKNPGANSYMFNFLKKF